VTVGSSPMQRIIFLYFLVNLSLVPPLALAGSSGDPLKGEAVLRDMGRASCLICHKISNLLDEKDQGEIGPALDNAGDQFTASELRARIMDARQINPDSIMPPYFSTKGLHNVARAYQGQTIYSAEDVENVVAYLLSLKEETSQ
jgi:sulfur-oxidizing protein SoxX